MTSRLKLLSGIPSGWNDEGALTTSEPAGDLAISFL